MGKAAKFKQIRRIAAGLTPLNRKFILGERVAGKELIGTEKDKEGNIIDPNLVYIKKKLIEVPLNHSRNMKKAYNKSGAAGVINYQLAVKRFVENNSK